MNIAPLITILSEVILRSVIVLYWLRNALAIPRPVSSLPSFLLPFTCGHVYVRTLSHGAELLEKRAEYAQANQILEHLLSQAIYGKGTRKKWWDRLALNFHYHLKDKEKVCNIQE